MIMLPDRVRKYNVRKTAKKASLCCQPKLEKPSKRNSVTKVAFDFNIETSVYFRELDKGKKSSDEANTNQSQLDQGLQ